VIGALGATGRVGSRVAAELADRRALLQHDDVSRAWQLTGPRPVTFTRIAAHVGARRVKVPPKLTVRAMRRRGVPAFEIEHRATGRPPRAVESFLEQHHDSFSPSSRLARILSNTTTKEHR
jgi:hypothetical protein